MNTLFPLTPVYPEGFQYFPGFLTVEEEKNLIETIRTVPLHNMIFQGYEAKRKVAIFGYDWSFEKRKLSRGKEIPVVFYPLIQKVSKKLKLKDEEMAELLVTEYPPASVINWHRDAPPFDKIIGISLLSDCVFRFRPHDKSKQGKHALIQLKVEPRSLYIMQGISRSQWEHSIAPVTGTRYSITLRTLNNTPDNRGHQ